MNTREKTKKTPELILDTAQALMLHKGFHGVSVDTIIEKSGVSKGTFFYHFKSKDALAERLLQRFTAHIGEIITALMDEIKNENLGAFDTLIMFLSRFPEQAAKLPGCLVASFSYQLLEASPTLEKISRASLDGWVDYFTPFIHEAFKEQNAAASVKPEEIAQMLFCLMEGAFITCRIGDVNALETQFKHLRNYLQLLALPGKA